MTKIITTNESKTGYAIKDGELILNIDEMTDDGKTLKLPDNSSNRKFYSLKKIQEGKTELTYKNSMTYGPRDKKNWQDYMTQEEKDALTLIKERCLERMAEDKPSDEELKLRKLLSQKEKILAKIAELQK